MAKKKKEQAQVLAQKQLAPGIYDCLLKTTLAKEAKPGQFIALYPKDKSTLLPRPISICEADAKKGTLRIVYRIAGAGTKEFSELKEGDTIDILGVLGNGFPIDAVKEDQTAFLMGGGIGVPPILELSKRLKCRKRIIVGYRDADCFLREDFEKNGEVYIATEDGSVGTKGNVMDAIRENALKADVIYACGPMPMFRAIDKVAATGGQFSFEERMGCGFGACMGCSCKTKYGSKRICKDGPVLEKEEIIW